MKNFLLATVFAAVAVSSASAQNGNPGAKAINTGGAAGAYHNTFCPPLPLVLANAYFQGYSCTPSAGTVENIARVMRQPTNLGFVQFDVFAREAAAKPQEFQKLTVVRTDIACEGLWMVTKNPDLDFGRVLALSRRIKFVLPPQASGSAASFNYLRSIDPEGLGRAPDSNITYLADATSVINHVANSQDGEVGFFVQFADPRNTNIKLMVDQKLRVLPVISREILRAQVGETPVYQAQTFRLAEGGMFGIGGAAQTATTTCTQVAVITGSPDAYADRNSQDDAREMIQKVREIPRDNLLPRDNAIAAILKGATRLSQNAVEQAVAGVDAARRAVENR
tara:strand:+ start:8077 stop:9087 length:1011 start_codon:yes stop_codon:yes gene_type:complete